MGLFSKDYVGSLEWEAVKNEGRDGKPQTTYRAKVLGGWLVETQNFAPACGGLTFVPDPQHEWRLDPVVE